MVLFSWCGQPSFIRHAQTAPAQTGGVETWTDAQIEEFLSKAKVVRTKGAR